MTSWRLWQALLSLQDAPIHPLYDRMYRRHIDSHNLRHRIWVGVVIVMGISGCGGVLIPGLRWLLPLMLMIVAPAAAILYLLFGGSICGAWWSLNISAKIARERERRTYDLLCVLPSGTFGACWEIATTYLRHTRQFDSVWNERLTVIMLAIGLSLLGMLIQHVSGQTESAWMLMFIAIPVISGYYIDYVHSVVLALLLGLYIPNYVSDPADTRLWTLGSFLLAQISAYLAAYLCGFVIVPALFRIAHLTGMAADAIPAFVALLVLFAMREGMIRLLWAALTERLNAEPLVPLKGWS